MKKSRLNALVHVCAFMLVVLSISSCKPKYPFENKPHSSFFFNLKGDVKEMRIHAKKALIQKVGYADFETTDLTNEDRIPYMFCCSYSGRDNSRHDLGNINMYYIPLDIIRNYSFTPMTSDIKIKFNNNGYITSYKLLDKEVEASEMKFSYKDKLVDFINIRWKNPSPDGWGILKDYDEFNNAEIRSHYDSNMNERHIDLIYKNNYLMQILEENKLGNYEFVDTKYNYNKVDNSIICISDKKRRYYFDGDTMNSESIDSIYWNISKDNQIRTATYFSNNNKMDVVIDNGKICNISSIDDYENEKYDDLGRIIKSGDYNIAYDPVSGIVKSISCKFGKSVFVKYNCEYQYDNKGNWTRIEIIPENRLKYDETIRQIKEYKDYLSLIKRYRNITMEDRYVSAKIAHDLVILEEWYKRELERIYSKYTIYRDIYYYK